jgi:hypothetical protein
MSDLTILYITNSKLDPALAVPCREYLKRAANGHPIVSVSQEPLDLGENVCVGELPYVALSIDVTIRAGLERVETPFVAIAEHDCIYSAEHFNYVPPDKEFFWYNNNNWLVQYQNPRFPQYDSMYSYFDMRRVQSQLICGTENFRDAIEEKIAILSDPAWLDRYPRGRIGEPGSNHLNRTKKLLRIHEDVRHLWTQIKKYITTYNAKDWETVVPNLDIRHEQNFTGQRRGTNRTWDLPPWGKFNDVINQRDPHNG